MTDTGSAHTRGSNRGRSVTTLARVRDRLREPAFWWIQSGVVAATAVHMAVEATHLGDHEGPFASLMHVPVVIYLLPVVYAGWHYGFEGGLLTGLWTGILTLPNLLLWHRAGYEWLGEAVVVGTVMGLGVVVAIPVERERLQRRRAERARQQATMVSRRLALLNHVTAALVRTADLDATLRVVLHRLMASLELDSAVLVDLPADGSPPVLVAGHSVDADAPQRLADAVAAGHRDLTDRPSTLAGGALAIPLAVGGAGHAALLVEPSGHRTPGLEERELLAAVAALIAVALDNASLHRDEQARLRAYLHGITRAQEDERQRIARDLHDIATHELLLARRDLEREPRDRHGADPAGVRGQVLARLGEVIDHLRRFSRDLRPSVLDHLGLAPALEWLASELQGRVTFTVGFELHGRPRRLSRDVELGLYRIAQEALRNVEQHAEPAHAGVELDFRSRGVRLVVRDDGCGFEVPERPETHVQHHRLGLMGMRERAALAGAVLKVVSTPGVGTLVVVDLPATGRAPADAPAAPGRAGTAGAA